MPSLPPSDRNIRFGRGGDPELKNVPHLRRRQHDPVCIEKVPSTEWGRHRREQRQHRNGTGDRQFESRFLQRRVCKPSASLSADFRRWIADELMFTDSLIQTRSVAEAYWALHNQPHDGWTHELDIRPYVEQW
jgi:hypothetical protein